MDAIQRRIAEQTIQSNDIGIEDSMRGRIGQALGGIIGSENPAAAWTQVAAQTGIPPEKAMAIQQALEQDPSLAEPLAASFGYSPQRQGSLPKELQIYDMLLQTRGPEEANAYLDNVAQGGGLSAYQAAMLSLRGQADDRAERRFQQDVREYENPRPSASERKEATERNQALQTTQRGLDLALGEVARLKQAGNDLERAGSIASGRQTGEQRAIASIYRNVPFLEQVFNNDGAAARDKIETIVNNMVLEALPLMTAQKLGARSFDAAKELEFHRAGS